MGPKLAFERLQAPQPQTNDEQVLADHDLAYLLQYLEESRGYSYELVERPDERERGLPAPDYLVSEKGSGRSIAIEHRRVIEEDLHAAKARLLKRGTKVPLIPWRQNHPAVMAQMVLDAVAQKIGGGQLQGILADERILLLRNRIAGTNAETFLGAPIHIPQRARGGVNHGFLIASGQLLQIW